MMYYIRMLLCTVALISLPIGAMQEIATADNPTALVSLLDAFIVGNGSLRANSDGSVYFPSIYPPQHSFTCAAQTCFNRLNLVYCEKSKNLEDIATYEEVLGRERALGITTQEAVKQVLESLNDEQKKLFQINRSNVFGLLFIQRQEPFSNNTIRVYAENRIKDLIGIRQATRDRAPNHATDARLLPKIERLCKVGIEVHQKLLEKPDILTSRYALLQALQEDDPQAINQASAQVVTCPEFFDPLKERLIKEAPLLTALYCQKK